MVRREIAVKILALVTGIFIGPEISFADEFVPPEVSVNLVSKKKSFSPDGQNELGLHFKIESGWHLYWRYPGDSGLPPRVAWELPDGVVAGELQWPAPERHAYGPIMNYGYEDEVLLPFVIEASESLTGVEQLKVAALVRWLVCKDVCVPGKSNVSLELPIKQKAESDTEVAELFRSTAKRIPRVDDHFGVAVSRGDEVFELELSHPMEKLAELKAVFFPIHAGLIVNAAPQLVERTDKSLRLLLKAGEKGASADKLEGVVKIEDEGGNPRFVLTINEDIGTK